MTNRKMRKAGYRIEKYDSCGQRGKCVRIWFIVGKCPIYQNGGFETKREAVKALEIFLKSK